MIKEPKYLDIGAAVQATSVSVCTCKDPSCGPHLVLWHGNIAIAHAALTVEIAKGVIQDISEVIEYKTGRKQ